MRFSINNANIDPLNAYNNTPIPSKVCTKCNQNKSLSEYNKDKSKSSGFRNNCKLCESIAEKQFRDNNRHINANKIYNENDVKQCSKCEQNKPLTDYQTNITTVDGLQSCCKSCQSITDKCYRDNNRQINSNKIYKENDGKICSKCQQSKLLTEFNKDNRKSDGLQCSCKSCKSIVAKHYHDNNRQINTNKIYNENDVKICSKCKQSKLITEYQKDISKSDGLQCSCKSCRSINTTNYRDNNKQIYAYKIYNENDVKTCSNCKQQKLYTEFYKCATKPLGLGTYCKQCESNYPKTIFAKYFSYVLSSPIRNNNNNCLSFTGCDANFL